MFTGKISGNSFVVRKVGTLFSSRVGNAHPDSAGMQRADATAFYREGFERVREAREAVRERGSRRCLRDGATSGALWLSVLRLLTILACRH